MPGWYFITTYKKKLILLAGFFVLAGCNYRINKSNDPAEGALSLSEPVSYEAIKSYSLRTCMNCHAGQKTPDLSTLENIKTNITKINSSIEISKMPPASDGYLPLSQCQKDVLAKWIELGFPEVSGVLVGQIPSCQNSFGPPVLTPILLAPLNYETLRSRILGPKCLLCHVSDSSDWEAAQVPFSPYAALVSESGKYWKAPAIKSKVYKEITNVDDGMPPPDADPKIPRLTDDEITFVQRWIDAGMPEK